MKLFTHIKKAGKMNFLFLDVDGVLNCQPYCKRTRKDINEENIKVLAKACKKYHFKVVLSSTWRELPYDHYMYLNLVESLGKYGIQIYAKTPIINCNRPLEILTWLRCNAHKGDKFVSIEDDCSYDEYKQYGLEKYLVHTDFFCMTEYEGGLQKYHLPDIDRIMRK